MDIEANQIGYFVGSSETRDVFHHISKLRLLCVGYLRINFFCDYERLSPNDIGITIAKLLYIFMKWDYFHDYMNRGLYHGIHGINNNGRLAECKYNNYCYCFYGISKIAMKPNSGIYQLFIKINRIHNYKINGNMIGICTNLPCNSTNNNNNNNNNNSLIASNNYIGWSSSWTMDNDEDIPYGLVCGYVQSRLPARNPRNNHNNDGNNSKGNIFRLNNFEYHSANGYYKDRLPSIEENDIIKLIYDSNENILWFQKENDFKLNSYINHLPKNETFYWVAGHESQAMSLTIV